MSHTLTHFVVWEQQAWSLADEVLAGGSARHQSSKHLAPISWPGERVGWTDARGVSRVTRLECTQQQYTRTNQDECTAEYSYFV